MRYDRNDFRVFFSWLPEVASSYIASNIDTIPRMIQHLLIASVICNFFFFSSSLGTLSMPNVGLNAVLISMTLSVQTTVLWIVLNYGKFSPRFRVLAPSEFIVGLSVGITIGAAVLTFFTSIYFGHVSKCGNSQNESNPICHKPGTAVALWFWGGLMFLINTLTTVLLVMGRGDLAYMAHGAYDSIDGIAMEDRPNESGNYSIPQEASATTSSSEYQDGSAVIAPQGTQKANLDYQDIQSTASTSFV